MSIQKLNAKELKKELWETLLEIRAGTTDPKTANAIAGQARGIISTINVEIAIQNSIGKLSGKLSGNLRDFTC